MADESGGAVDFESRKAKPDGGPVVAFARVDLPSLVRGVEAADAQELAIRAECEAAMLECGISNPRMLRVMVDAMRMQMQRERMAGVEVRMMMVQSWQRWKADAQFMRHSIGPRKFFGEGYWIDEKLWPTDFNRLDRERERRSRL